MQYQLKLKVVWCRGFLALAIDQLILNRHYYPLTSYYLWSKTNAWEQLKAELNLKPWLNKKEKIEILNLATEVMNHWLQYRNIQDTKNIKKLFNRVLFININ